jgi:hypothetical protein
MTKLHTISIVCAVALVHIPSPAYCQPGDSKAAAEALTKALDRRKLDAIAARDPQNPNRFVAALYYPGTQLLVVSGTYGDPSALDQRIASGQYKDVYADIGSTRPADGRYFVMDLGGDGLRDTREKNEPFDIVYRNGRDQISYNGDWKQQKMSESEYRKRFVNDEAEYAHALATLTASLTASASTPGAN